MSFYKDFVRPVAFWLSRDDPEKAHDWAIATLRSIRHIPGALKLLSSFTHTRNGWLERKVAGLWFPHPIGLAAGFDKNALAVEGLAALGFGFIEIGTVTQNFQAGNPRPRIFRLERDHALINRMGFPNHGAMCIRQNLEAMRKRSTISIPIGVSIGRSLSNRWWPDGICHEYQSLVRQFWTFADYFAINISSPNTARLRELQQKEYPSIILKEIAQAAQSLRFFTQKSVPLFLKVAPNPDLSPRDFVNILEQLIEHRFDGIILANTTLSRDGLTDSKKSEVGGVSGHELLRQETTKRVFFTRRYFPQLAIICVGGIRCTDHVTAALDYGADLVQILTALPYEGPFLPMRMHRELAHLL